MTTTPNNPFASWTADRLILCNYLRETPHTYSTLTRFANHKNLSLRVAANRLRQKGQAFGPRLTKDNKVVADHPANQALELFPLPDPPADIPKPYSRQNAAIRASAQTMALLALPDTKVAAAAEAGLSGADLIRMVDSYILQGGGGRDFLKAIELRSSLSNLDVHSGPPVPLSPTAQAAELLLLLKDLPPDVCTEAWALYCQSRESAPPPSPPDAPEDLPLLDAGLCGPNPPPDQAN